jgi:superfamily II DNA or RNA helicase
MTPRIAYPIALPGGRLQAAASADRPLCAMTAALAAVQAGMPLRGEYTGKVAWECKADIQAWANAEGHNFVSMNLWADGIRGCKIPYQWPTTINGLTLSEYQLGALDKLTCAGGVLALGCGLGKTITALAAAQAYGGRLLIICPLNAVPTWTKAAPKGTMIVSMDSAHKLLGLPATGGTVIFDEAHMLGEPTTRRTKACHAVRAKFDRGLCLTGTLLHGGVVKALSVMDLAVPGSSLFSSRWKAGEHFSCLVRKAIGGRTVTELVTPSGQNRDAFVTYLSRMVVALTHNSPEVRAAFQLPEQHLYEVQLEEPWRPLEQAVAALVHEKIAAGEPGIVNASEAAHALCAAGAEAKVDWVMENLEDEPTVIFANYTATLDLMEAALVDAGITYVRVDGSVTGTARGECQRKFQAGEAKVFLGQMSASGVAMDLFAARYSIAMDHPWKAADYAQALARTARRGQTQETHHWDLCANRLQAKVVQRLRAGDEFNASVAEWQAVKSALTAP